MGRKNKVKQSNQSSCTITHRLKLIISALLTETEVKSSFTRTDKKLQKCFFVFFLQANTGYRWTNRTNHTLEWLTTNSYNKYCLNEHILHLKKVIKEGRPLYAVSTSVETNKIYSISWLSISSWKLCCWLRHIWTSDLLEFQQRNIKIFCATNHW